MINVQMDLISSAFMEALVSVILKVSGFALSDISDNRAAEFDELAACMCLNSKKGGILFVSAKKPDIKAICSYMLGVPDDDVLDSDIEDVLCELVNMTAGTAKLQLTGTDYMFSLSTPFLIRGDNLSIITKKRASLVSKVLGNGEVTLKLTIVY